jgi:competence protein ComEA
MTLPVEGEIENNSNDLWAKISLWQKAVLGLGAILLAVGVVWLAKSISQSNETRVEIIPGEATPAGVIPEKKAIYIDVAGAVITPGVYLLDDGQRTQAALAAAGGLAAEADRDWVAKNVNLAAPLKDGQKIFIPRTGAGGAGIDPTISKTTPGVSSGIAAESTVNINSASAGELDTLPGVGPATAAKIISGRPYTKAEDLIEKKIVSQKVFDNLKDKISFY